MMPVMGLYIYMVLIASKIHVQVVSDPHRCTLGTFCFGYRRLQQRWSYHGVRMELHIFHRPMVTNQLKKMLPLQLQEENEEQ